ncbi:MAG: hypothetical protein K8T90_00295 [Planctomycetes bacterium]|nr:hypothetical protein [Planctomycetota bacterium]
MESLPLWVLVGLAFAGLVVLVAVLLNVHKLLSRVAAIRRDVEQVREGNAREQLAEAVAQLQSVAVSMDRVAMRCDMIHARLGEIVARAPAAAAGGADVGPAVDAIRAGLAELKGPVSQIRDLLGRTDVERLADEVRRSLYAQGFDGVTILTDLGVVPRVGDAKVQVEVVREGMKSKGTVLVRDGSAVETKISPIHGMFP